MFRRTIISAGVIALFAVALAGWFQLPGIGAGALLHPARHMITKTRPPECEDATFAGDGVSLRGWRCAASGNRRGTIIYLHGIADNRGSATGVIARYTARGLDVIAYDSRAHGESEGTACTYGFFERQDLRRVIDTIRPSPIVLIGTSLGAAVALQEAADDPRITAIVAAETFSDLRTVATERAPLVFTRGTIDRSFALAESQANFDVDGVSPEKAAAGITVPVLLLHGAADVETPPSHSERVRRALAGPSELILVPGAGHNQSLNGDAWRRIDTWIDNHLR